MVTVDFNHLTVYDGDLTGFVTVYMLVSTSSGYRHRIPAFRRPDSGAATGSYTSSSGKRQHRSSTTSLTVDDFERVLRLAREAGLFDDLRAP